MQKSMEFSLKSNVNGLEELRVKSNQALKKFDYPESTIQSQMTVINALVASANKFEDLKSSDIEIAILMEMKTDSITVEVKKSVDDSAFCKLDQLDQVIQWLRSNPDSYETHGFPHASDTNGFALAKIACETGAVIDFYVSENNILNLSAVCNVAM
ncbi:MAG: hypothetical protein QNJ58_11600 [Desulfobacterales bacterium]|nr:hypothetical protein [Desulfobacterales bacterium]